MTRGMAWWGIRFLALVLCFHGGSAVAESRRDARIAAHRDRIIVKYRPTVRACAHCLVARGVPFATVTGTDSLDRLNRQIGVRGAHQLLSGSDAFAGDRAAAYAVGVNTVRARFAARTVRVRQATIMPNLSNVFVLDLPHGMDATAAAALYATDPDVEYAQPDYRRTATFVPDDPLFLNLWGVQVTQAPMAWDTANGNGIVVAVVDSGIDYTHPDLAGNVWTNSGEIPGNGVDDDGNGFIDDVRGWDFVRNDDTPFDADGHGTHVAGTVAAAGNNGTGVVGMAWGARIMPVRGLDANGNGYDSDLAAAIVYAARNGADVLNLSWGGYGQSWILRDAVATASGLGAVVVAAAGNDGNDISFLFEPAAIPEVIAVAASGPGDIIADFSNFGAAVSVAAPGVDILSLRADGSSAEGGVLVGTKYISFSGTSTAAPHAAGLAAVLLSVLPNLSVDEVRWHLELHADQPGYPGYEGERWNPRFGWGRINAARVFETPPVTTRFREPYLFAPQVHAFPETLLPDVSRLEFSFTTHDPVAWTIAHPSWLVPDAGSGSGEGDIRFSVDTTSLPPGDQTGAVVLNAPLAADGGGSRSATLHVHRDERIGGEALLAAYAEDYVTSLPHVVSDGFGSLVVWSARPRPMDPTAFAAHLDTDGSVTGPVALVTGWPYKERVAAAFDGRNYLVAWIEHPDNHHKSVWALRVGPTGAPLDTVPILLDSRRLKYDGPGGGHLDVAFDGGAYVVLWKDQKPAPAINFRRVGTDGSVRSPRRRLPAARWNPKIACDNGTNCLVAWAQYDHTTLKGRYVYDIRAVRLNGERVIDGTPLHLLGDVLELVDVASNGTEYLVLASRYICPSRDVCGGTDAVAGRVTSAGVALDFDGIRLNNTAPPDPRIGPVENFSPISAVFDGTNWVATFLGRASGRGFPIFAARIGPDGHVRDTESSGLLLHGGGTAGAGGIATTRTHSVIAWQDSRSTDPDDRNIFPGKSVWAERVLAHQPAPAFREIEIGTIGPRSVSERAVLGFALAASSLDPATTTFAASHLPAGARFDAATGTFRWMPAANEAGLYPGVRFEANDGVRSVREDVTIRVLEADLSLSGTVRDASGQPRSGIAIKLTGAIGQARTLFSDASGRFQFDDLVPGGYTLRLARPSAHDFKATPRTVAIGAADVSNADITISPKASS